MATFTREPIAARIRLDKKPGCHGYVAALFPRDQDSQTETKILAQAFWPDGTPNPLTQT
jgi:hypothetical protein